MKNVSNLVEFQRDVLNNDKVVLVDFYADWCGPCQALAPKLDELQEEYASKLDIVKVDIEKSPELAEKYEIRGIPALFFVRNGDIQLVLSGNQRKETLSHEIERLIS